MIELDKLYKTRLLLRTFLRHYYEEKLGKEMQGEKWSRTDQGILFRYHERTVKAISIIPSIYIPIQFTYKQVAEVQVTQVEGRLATEGTLGFDLKKGN